MLGMFGHGYRPLRLPAEVHVMRCSSETSHRSQSIWPHAGSIRIPLRGMAPLLPSGDGGASRLPPSGDGTSPLPPLGDGALGVTGGHGKRRRWLRWGANFAWVARIAWLSWRRMTILGMVQKLAREGDTW